MLPSCRFLPFALLAALAGALAAGPARADDRLEPYQLRIVVHVARHRLLTDVFRQQLERELKDGMQAALGKLARVEVVGGKPKDQPLARRLDDVLARGLQKALDGWRERSPYKTHFVLIDYSGTHYQIQARQHDGLTGLPSPAVRRRRTRDRAYVARAAALLIEHDLGLVGTVESEPDSDGKVRVELRGGGLGVDLSRWIKKDEVLALVRVAGDRPGQEMPWAFLQVETPAADGACTCRVYRRYPGLRVKGLRCVLLGTRSGSMRLRVVQEKRGGGYGELESSVRLEIRRHGFEGEESTLLKVFPDGTRDVDTAREGEKGRFDRVAFVSVLSGAQRKARIPVALVDDRVILLPIPRVDEETTLALERFRLLGRSVVMAYLVQADLFDRINKLTATPDRRAEALAQVKETLARSRDDYDRLSRERDAVEKEVARLPEKDRPSFSRINNRLKMISDGERDLMKHVKLLEEIEKTENDPKRKEWLIQVERARVFEKDGDLDKAIEIYEKAPEAERDTARKKLADLKARWKPKNDKHNAARWFIYVEWPLMDTAAMAAKIDKAREAFEVCKKEDDRVGPLKLLRVNEKHGKRLLKEGSELKPDVNIDDEKPAKLIADLLPKLRDLDRDITAYLAGKPAE